MEYRKFDNMIVARVNRGEEVIEKLTDLAKKENIQMAQVCAIGATDYFSAGLYNVEEKKYYSNEYHGDYEILSLLGNINRKDGDVYIHLHISAADADGHVYGGHLKELRISATCEIIITLIDGKVGRMVDDETGLNIFKFD